MADQVIRDVVVRVAIETKQARQQAAFGTSTPLPAGTDLNEIFGGKDVEISTASVSKNIATLKKELMGEANEVRRAAQAHENLNRRIDAQKSAVMGAYGASTEATMRLAKGIAFVAAANDQQAESFVRSIAAAQGYFDLVSGGVHIVKGWHDIQRQSTLLMSLQAQATGTAAVSTAGLATAQVSLLATAAPLGVAVGAVAAALYGLYRMTSYAFIEVPNSIIADRRKELELLRDAANQAADSVGRIAEKSLAMNRFTAQHLVREGSDQDLDALQDKMQRDIDKLQKQRAFIEREGNARLDKIANGHPESQRTFFGFIADAAGGMAARGVKATGGAGSESEGWKQREVEFRKQELINAEALSKIDEQINAAELARLEVSERSVKAKENEVKNARQLAEESRAAWVAESNRNQAENVRLGLMSRQDQHRAKRILDKVASGGELTYREAQQASQLGIARGHVEKFAKGESDRLGLTQAREAAGETSPLKFVTAKMNEDAKHAQEHANELVDVIHKRQTENTEAFKKLGTALEGQMSLVIQVNKLTEIVERLNKAVSNNAMLNHH